MNYKEGDKVIMTKREEGLGAEIGATGIIAGNFDVASDHWLSITWDRDSKFWHGQENGGFYPHHFRPLSWKEKYGGK